MLVVFAIGFLLLSTRIFVIFCIALLFTTFGQSLLRVVMTSQVVGYAPGGRRGEVLGIMSSITSLSMTISPFISGLLYEKYAAMPFLVSSFYLLIAFVVLYQKRQQLAKEQLPEDVEMESAI